MSSYNPIPQQAPMAAPVPPVAPQPKQTGSKWLPLVALLVCGLLFGVAYAVSRIGESSRGSDTSTSHSGALPPATKVTYKVVGSADEVAITFSTPTGTRQEKTSLPLENQTGTQGLILTGFDTGDSLYISAQNQGDTGSVTCIIEVDGQ